MLWTALQDSDPVLIFEHSGLYNKKGELPADAGPVDIDKARVRRNGRDVTLIAYGAGVWQALDAAEALSPKGIESEVIDLRSLRPLDEAAFLESVRRTHRAVVIDEGWRSGGLSAEICARIQEKAFYDLDAPIQRVCSAEVPAPYAKHLEDASLPSAARIIACVEGMIRANA